MYNEYLFFVRTASSNPLTKVVTILLLSSQNVSFGDIFL
jgi:hypothetical protein